ncbi:Sb-PDE family phosphodiesterase [Maribacter litopenaei]|uniref:Sb-PDE family phosphodiesterase n=1 Tax=Maribacter litopenaei TaxID=2976127 RepID=A0ABY5Y9F2_9FLAO|nr:Sb-PDE family phosphodiesterase [Maribacter litopenaei]UWX55675.1 Sb-PDE family phosphodiesterase [Maribacter litopenaei]
MGTSDVHGLIDWDYTEKGNHRPITLVFAKEKSLPSIKEALFAGRTVAIYNDLWVGKAMYMMPLLEASIKVESAKYAEESNVLQITLKNVTSSDLLFQNDSEYTFYDSSPVFEIEAGQTKTLHLKTLQRKTSVELKLRALGCFVAPETQPVVTWMVNPDN